MPTNDLKKLTPEQIEAFGKEMDDLRARIVADLGEKDAEYIRGVVNMQKKLEVAGRAMLWAGWFPPAFIPSRTAAAAGCRRTASSLRSRSR